MSYKTYGYLKFNEVLYIGISQFKTHEICVVKVM